MSIFAGSIVTVGGAHVIDRLQTAGLGNVNVPIDTVREIGNDLVVDKVPQEPEFTWTMQSLDVSCDLMAWLTGKVGAQASGSAPGHADASGTEYKWTDAGWVNITSPWKDYASGAAGNILAGHIVPALFPTRMTYNFGAAADSTQEVQLGSGEFYYADFAPVEEYATGDGSATAFATSESAVVNRVGSGVSTKYAYVWGVIVNGVLMIEGEDYTVTPAAPGANGVATIHFTVAPAAAAVIKYTYFSTAAHAWPQTVHTSTIVKPGAVRGRNIAPWIYVGGQRIYLHGVQTATLTADITTTVTRELGSDKIIGRSIQGPNVNGDITVEPRDAAAFIDFLSKVTGVAATEVVGFFYQNPLPMGIDIQDPKNPTNILKTLFVPDAEIQPPGTPARVNQATQFSFHYEGQTGTFSEFRAGHPGF